MSVKIISKYIGDDMVEIIHTPRDSLKKKKIMSVIKTCPVTKSLHPDIKIEFVEE
jgi:hypothetical protein